MVSVVMLSQRSTKRVLKMENHIQELAYQWVWSTILLLRAIMTFLKKSVKMSLNQEEEFSSANVVDQSPLKTVRNSWIRNLIRSSSLKLATPTRVYFLPWSAQRNSKRSSPAGKRIFLGLAIILRITIKEECLLIMSKVKMNYMVQKCF